MNDPRSRHRHAVHRLLAAGLIAALLGPVGPRPAVAATSTATLRAGLEGRESEIAAGLEATLPNVAISHATPLLGPLYADPGRTLKPLVDAAQGRHARLVQVWQWAIDAQGSTQRAVRFGKIVPAIENAVKAWTTLEQSLKTLEQVPDAARKKQWATESAPGAISHTAILDSVKGYVTTGKAAAERALVYAQAHAAPLEPIVDMTTSVTPAPTRAPFPSTPAEPSKPAPPGLREGGELAAEFKRLGWAPDSQEAAAFIKEIQSILRGLRDTPFVVFRGLVYQGSALTPPHEWVARQLEAVAESHDFGQRSAQNAIVASTLPLNEIMDAQVKGLDRPFAPREGMPSWSDDLRQAKTLASEMFGHRVHPSEITPETLENVDRTLRTLVAALWRREFTDPLPSAAGLEEPRTFGTVFDYGLLAQPDALWRTPTQWRTWLGSPGGAAYLRQLYGGDPALTADRRAAYLRVLAQYERDYGAAEPVAIFRASGRVHWLGVHIDRSGAEAPVNRFGINGRELIMVAGRQPEGNLTVQLRSTLANPFGQAPYRLDFDVKTQVFDRFPDAPIKLTDSTATEENSWNQMAYRMGDAIRVDGKTPVEFVAGVAYLLHHGVSGGLTRGFRAAMEGNIPPAMGMSTSSALTIAISQAFTAVNRIELVERDPAPGRRQITFADWLTRTGYAEWIVGTRGATGDHRTILFSRPGEIPHLGATEVLARMQLPASVEAVVLNTPPRKDDDDETSANRVAAYQRGLRYLRRVFIGQETLGAIVASGATPVAIATAIRDQIPEEDVEARATTLAQIADIARSFAMRRLLEDHTLPDAVKIARLFQMTKAYQEQQRTTDYDGDPAPWNLAVVAKTGITNAALDAWIAQLKTDLPPDSPYRLENLATLGAYGVSVATVDDMVRALQRALGEDWAHVAPIMQGVGFGGTVLTFVDTAQPGLLDRVTAFYRAYAAQHFPKTVFMEPILVKPGRGAEALVPPAAAGMEEFGPFTRALSPGLVQALEGLRRANPAAVERFVALQQAAADRWRRLLSTRRAPLHVAIVVPAYAGDIPRIQRQDALSWKLQELQALAVLAPAGHVRFTVYVVDDKPAPGLAEVVGDAVDRTWYDPDRITVQFLRLVGHLDRVPGLSRAEDSRKWGAVRAGMAMAISRGADVVATSDSDTNQRLTELPNLLAPILDDGAAAAVGSRFLPGATTTAMGIHNYLEAFLYNPFVDLAMPELGRLPIRDVQSGVKAFSAAALREPLDAMRGVGFAADAELLWLIAKAGGRIIETPRSEVEESLGASTIVPTKHYALTREVQAALAEHGGPALSAQAEQVAARIPRTPAAVEAVAHQQARLAEAVDALQTGRPFNEVAVSVRDVFAPAAGMEEPDAAEEHHTLRDLQGLQGAMLVERAQVLLEVPGEEASIRNFFGELGLQTPFLETAKAVVQDTANANLRVATANTDEQALLALAYAADWVQAATNVNPEFRQRAVTTIVKTMDEAGVPLVVLRAEGERLPVNAVTDLGVMAPSDEEGVTSRFGTRIKFSDLRFAVPAELAAQFPRVPSQTGLEEGPDVVEDILKGEPIEGLSAVEAGAAVTALQRYADTAEWSWGQQFPYRAAEGQLWVFSQDQWVLQGRPRVAAGEDREDAWLQTIARDLSVVVAGWLRPSGSGASRVAHIEEDFVQITVAPVMPQTVLDRIGRADLEGLRRYRILVDPETPVDRAGRAMQGRLLRFLVEEQYFNALPPLPDAAGLEEHGAAQRRVDLREIRLNQEAKELRRRGDWRGALEKLDEALRINPNNPITLTSQSSLFVQRHRYQDALATTEKALTLDPRGVQTYIVRAQAFNGLGRYQDAEGALSTAIAIDPRNDRSHIIRGWYLLAHGHPDEARQAFVEAIRINKTSDAVGILGDWETAVADARRREVRELFDHPAAVPSGLEEPDRALERAKEIAAAEVAARRGQTKMVTVPWTQMKLIPPDAQAMSARESAKMTWVVAGRIIDLRSQADGPFPSQAGVKYLPLRKVSGETNYGSTLNKVGKLRAADVIVVEESGVADVNNYLTRQKYQGSQRPTVIGFPMRFFFVPDNARAVTIGFAALVREARGRDRSMAVKALTLSGADLTISVGLEMGA